MRKIATFIIFILISFSGIAQDLTELNKGDKVDKFSALDDQGNTWKSSEITSDFLVVYFYPAAMTGGCTKQACAYRDDKASFDKMSVSVVGVSGDEVKNLQGSINNFQMPQVQGNMFESPQPTLAPQQMMSPTILPNEDDREIAMRRQTGIAGLV